MTQNLRSRRLRLRYVPSALRIWALALTLAASPGSAETVTFNFAPPAGSSYAAKQIETTEIRVGADRDLHTVAALITMRVAREAGAVYISRRYDQLAAAKEGEPFETPPQIKAMLGLEVVTVVRPDGSLLRVNGYQQISARALPLMQGEAKKALEKYIAEGRQDDRDQAAWFELEMLSGQTLELDRDYWFDAAWPDESGWVPHQTLIRFGPWVNHERGKLLAVNLAYVASAKAQIPTAIQLVPKVKSKHDPLHPGAIAPSLKIDGGASWLIDPATLLVWKLQGRRKVSEPLQVSSDLGVTIVTEEKIDVTLEPIPAPATK